MRSRRTVSVIGYLSGGGPNALFRAAFHKGLSEQGFVEGRNVEILLSRCRHTVRSLAPTCADLVNRRVDVIFAVNGTVAALAAKAVTPIIPIVFASGSDPVQNGLVPALNHPGANVTGVSGLITELIPKRLELLHELVPAATSIGYLVNPAGVLLTQKRRRVLSAFA
jgi:putative tryptophan/tyrosine transport system substrate-binding protein